MDSATKSPERCDECHFDPGQWNDQDVANTFREAASLVRRWRAPLPDANLNVRVQPDTWSVAEYTDHLRENLWICRFITDLAVKEPGHDLGPVDEPQPTGRHRILDFQACLDALALEAHALHTALSNTETADWDNDITLDGHSHTVRDVSRHFLHDLWHHLADIALIGRRIGGPCPNQRGAVSRISISSGGVPKTEVESAEIGRRGLVGDTQSTRRHHGRPWQALCLWSSEVVAALADEGHPISPGAAGENITISGLDWNTLHAGAFISIGEVACQLSAPTSPCFKIRSCFADNDSDRIYHDTHPGFSRWYASVITPGVVSNGDVVKVGQTHGL